MNYSNKSVDVTNPVIEKSLYMNSNISLPVYRQIYHTGITSGGITCVVVEKNEINKESLHPISFREWLLKKLFFL
jgi:hypothetical protein